jgi:DNA end-binding protein Ku
MRTTWNGSISFGLVTIPVGLAPATAVSARQSDVQFKMLHRTCLTPIKQKRWCPVHEVDLSPDEIVRGFEVAKGEFVPVEDGELEAIESHETSRAIAITRFVPSGEVDPIYFDRTYYLVPAGLEAQRRPYKLLAEAMRADGVSALGSFVLAGKEKLCLIRPHGDALVLETLFLAEDVKSQEEIDEALSGKGASAEELALARQIVAALEGPFEPESLRSDYRTSLRELLRAKIEGRPAAEAPDEEPQAPVIDLMEALRATVAATKGTPAKRASARSKAAAKR